MAVALRSPNSKRTLSPKEVPGLRKQLRTQHSCLYPTAYRQPNEKMPRFDRPCQAIAGVAKEFLFILFPIPESLAQCNSGLHYPSARRTLPVPPRRNAYLRRKGSQRKLQSLNELCNMTSLELRLNHRFNLKFGPNLVASKQFLSNSFWGTIEITLADHFLPMLELVDLHGLDPVVTTDRNGVGREWAASMRLCRASSSKVSKNTRLPQKNESKGCSCRMNCSTHRFLMLLNSIVMLFKYKLYSYVM